jgi:hypothetical protein
MLEGLLDVWRVRRPGRPQDDEPDPVWSELRGETPPQPFDRAAGDPIAAVVGHGRGRNGDGHDHPGPLPDHPPRRRARGEELGPRSFDDRLREVLSGHVDEQDPLDVHADGVEQDVDPLRPGDHVVHVLLDRVLVQRIDLCRLGDAARGGDLLGDRLDLRLGATGEEEVGAFGANVRATAPPIAPAAP